MMDRQKGKLVFECDACGEVLETGESDFEEARAVFKAAEWKAVMGQGRKPEWEHYCAECKGASA